MHKLISCSSGIDNFCFRNCNCISAASGLTQVPIIAECVTVFVSSVVLVSSLSGFSSLGLSQENISKQERIEIKRIEILVADFLFIPTSLKYLIEIKVFKKTYLLAFSERYMIEHDIRPYPTYNSYQTADLIFLYHF